MTLRTLRLDDRDKLTAYLAAGLLAGLVLALAMLR